jgi:hypothetical protein
MYDNTTDRTFVDSVRRSSNSLVDLEIIRDKGLNFQFFLTLEENERSVTNSRGDVFLDIEGWVFNHRTDEVGPTRLPRSNIRLDKRVGNHFTLPTAYDLALSNLSILSSCCYRSSVPVGGLYSLPPPRPFVLPEHQQRAIVLRELRFHRPHRPTQGSACDSSAFRIHRENYQQIRKYPSGGELCTDPGGVSSTYRHDGDGDSGYPRRQKSGTRDPRRMFLVRMYLYSSILQRLPTY